MNKELIRDNSHGYYSRETKNYIFHPTFPPNFISACFSDSSRVITAMQTVVKKIYLLIDLMVVSKTRANGPGFSFLNLFLII